MIEVQEVDWEIRHFPLRGMDHSAKAAVVAPGYSWYEENFVHDRRSARKRPCKRKINAHAVGRDGVYFDGASFGVPSYNANLEIQGPFTFEAWVTPKTEPGATINNIRGICRRGTDIGYSLQTNAFDLYLRRRATNGDMEFRASVYDGVTNYARGTGANTAALDVRSHIAVTWDPTDGITIFLNGAKVGATLAGAGNPAALTDQGWKFNVDVFEDIRIWNYVRTDTQIANNRSREVDAREEGLIANWQGNYGTGGRINDRTASETHLWLFPAYPEHYAGVTGGGIYFTADEAGGGYALMELTDATVHNINEFHFNLASGNSEHGVQFGLTLQDHRALGAANTRFCYGPIVIDIDDATRVVVAHALDNPAKTVTSTTALVPGCRHTIGVRRNAGELWLYIDGAEEDTDNTLTETGVTATDISFGGQIVTGSLNECHCLVDEFTFYGADPGAAAFTGHADWPIEDDFGTAGIGDGVLLALSVPVTNASATVTTAQAASSWVNKFLVVRDDDGTTKAYHIASVVVGVSATLSTAYEGRTNAAQFCVITSLLAQWLFRDPWETAHNDIASGTPLPEVIADRLGVFAALDLYGGDGLGNVPVRKSGRVVSEDNPCAGMRRYHKEGEITTTLGVWGSSLYMISDRWTTKVPPSAEGLKSVRVMPGDFWARAADGSSGGPPAFTGDNRFNFANDIYFETVEGKQVLYADGDRRLSGVGGVNLLIYVEDGYLKAEWEWNDGATGTTATFVSDNACIRPGWRRVEIQLRRMTSPLCYFVIDGSEVDTTAANFPIGGQAQWAATTIAERSLYGLRDLADGAIQDQHELIAEGFGSLRGIVHQFRIGTGGLFSGDDVPERGLLSDTGTASVLCTLEEGEGWAFGDSAAASDGLPICNHGRFCYPILEDIPPGDAANPYSLATYRGVLYGTNGLGRQIRAEWTGDFTDGGNGWKVGFAGIQAPKHRLTAAASATAASSFVAGDYQLAYCYLDGATGRRSNPSEIVEFTLPGATQIRLTGIQPSEDPRVTAIEVYTTYANSSYIGKVMEIPNEALAVELDFSVGTVRAGDELEDVNAVPPAAKFLRFNLGRAYWGNLDGGEGNVAFSEADNEEAFYALNQIKVDSAEWRPVSGLSGQNGLVYAHTQTAIFYIIPGATDVTSFQKRLMSTRAGALHGASIVEYNGAEEFLSRDGIYAMMGNEKRPVSRATELDFLGRDDESDLGIDFSAPAWGAYDSRNRCTYWLFRRSGDAFSGLAFCRSRHLGEDDAAWSLLDFYDASALVEAEDVDGKEIVYLADSWGYVWALNGEEADMDYLGGSLEDGTTQTTKGVWNTDAMLGPQVGDGLRGYTCAIWDTDSAGVITDRGMIRLETTPGVGGVPVTWEGSPFTPTNDSTNYVLGGVIQRMDLPWTPGGGYELDKRLIFFDAAFEPAASESFLLEWYAAQAGGRAMDREFETADAVSRMVPMDSGLTQGEELNKDPVGRAAILSLTYIGESKLELYEVVTRGTVRGNAWGATKG